MATIIKPTTTVTERWLNEQASGIVSPAQFTTPVDDMALASCIWGSDSNGKYFMPNSSTAVGAGHANLPGTGSMTIGICFLDNGTTPGSDQSLLNLQNESAQAIFRMYKNTSGNYVYGGGGPGFATDTSAPIASPGLVYLVGVFDQGGSLLHIYVNGVAGVDGAGTVRRTQITTTTVYAGYAVGDLVATAQLPYYFAFVDSTVWSAPTVLAAYNALFQPSSSSSSLSSSSSPSPSSSVVSSSSSSPSPSSSSVVSSSSLSSTPSSSSASSATPPVATTYRVFGMI